MLTPARSGAAGAPRSRSLQTVTTRIDAFNVCKQALDLLDAARVSLALAYAGAPSHSPQENALGEVLTYTRKAIEKATKHGNELGQLEFDFGDGGEEPRDQ